MQWLFHCADYKSATQAQRTKIMTRHNNNGPASNADNQLSPREKFRVKSFIPIIECLHAILSKQAAAYVFVANEMGKKCKLRRIY